MEHNLAVLSNLFPADYFAPTQPVSNSIQLVVVTDTVISLS